MSSWLRSALFALPFLTLALASTHCNPDPPPAAPGDGGAGDESGGEGGGDGAPSPGDAPTFAGVKSVAQMGDTQLAVAWDPATDAVSPASKIAYKIYVATAVGAWNFKSPWTTSVAGATNAILTGLTPNTTYSVVVRAIDEAGHEDANVVHKENTTLDVTPPVFLGVKTVTGTDRDKVTVVWDPATDDGSPSNKIRYRVYVGSIPGGEDFTTPAVKTAPGVTTAVVSGLPEAKPAYVIVRAVDESGNVDSNLHEASGTTLDKTPPTFAGLATATASGTSVTLGWAPATDNVDPPASIVYDVYVSKVSGGEVYAKATYTTPAGATTFTAIGLDVSTKYYFVVRARDVAGNEDTNVIERAATTAASADVTPPVFAGVTTATAASASSITLTWTAATDDFTPAPLIVYDVYTATSAGGEVFTTPTFSSAPGATTFTITGLKPSTTTFVVVRARDQAGNRDGNVAERSATTTADTTAPTFAGLVSAIATGPTSIQLSWSAASDDVSLPGAIRYRVYQASATGGEVFTTPIATTGGGVTSYVVNALVPATTYWFVVRAVDEAGNSDSNKVEKNARTAADTTAPTFGGVVTFVPQTVTSALASWSPATDDVTPPAGIVYLVYLGTASGAESITPTATTAPGASSYALTGLAPNTTYYVIVRARDAAGNIDTNAIERIATTPADVTAPTFAGATGVSGASSTSLTVNWSAATDDSTPAASIKYFICSTTTAGGCNGGAFVASASVTGATSYSFTTLTPSTTYYFVVRAQDATGNRDTNSVQVSGITVADAVPPTFAGIVSATATGDGSALLTWAPGLDDVTPVASLVYDIYRGVSAATVFSGAPIATSSAGATSYSVTGLTPSTTYFFGVRARDLAGNRDSNVVTQSATTSADTTAPTFGGATSVVALSETSLRVSWSPASDDTTPAASIVYKVCYSTSPTACTTSFTASFTTSAGVTSYTFGGVGVLTPATTYYVVVRARDLSGNTDANVSVQSGTTLSDTTAPVWTSGPTVAAIYDDVSADSGAFNVSWTAATDNAWPSANIRYVICVGGGCSPTVTTAYGATSASITGLTSHTNYTIFVNAQDQSGNTEGGSHSMAQQTAASYSNDISAIFNLSNASGGCNGGAGCHSPLWNYANTVNVVDGCGGFGYRIRPTSPSLSLIYHKMTGTQGSCGSQMPLGGPYIAAFQTTMLDWINQGAHNN